MPLLSNNYTHLTPDPSPSGAQKGHRRHATHDGEPLWANGSGQGANGAKYSDIPSPLSAAIQQLQSNATALFSGAHTPSTSSVPLTQPATTTAQQPHTTSTSSASKPQIAEKPRHPRVSEWAETDPAAVGDSSGSGSDSDSSRQSTLKRATSSGTVDSNTLPFANENVGTIKQRSAPPAKPSILSAGEAGEGEEEPRLNTSVFEDCSGGMDTIRRGARPQHTQDAALTSGQQHAALPGGRAVPPPTPVRSDSVNAMQNNSAAANSRSKDVLNDIGNMLQDLSNELDAMLDDNL